ncbi:hypothetical protein SDC9_54097 [bioreactor metagenome]|uniref:Uncharacterized protein n=1 Tax=bioreactor metagenome TaxID=1076179 RepID=A0A644WVI6_9ZZZZ
MAKDEYTLGQSTGAKPQAGFPSRGHGPGPGMGGGEKAKNFKATWVSYSATAKNTGRSCWRPLPVPWAARY